ncbi:MAG: hypothetical protein IPK58_13445 [Acidobacteria bacterium]|nr:hypothetical protein [Acidobacteriota bacterium]
MDEEALYTIVGGLKPMSSGFQSIQIQTGLPRWTLADAETAVREIGSKRQEDLTSEEKVRLSQSKQTLERRDALTRADQTRVILAHWRCGDELFADLQHFARQFDGKRFLDALVISRPRLRHALSEKADFFSRWGITVNSHPLEVVYGIDTDETSARFAGYGYLFGYPDHAVRFLFKPQMKRYSAVNLSQEISFRSQRLRGRRTILFMQFLRDIWKTMQIKH